MQQKIRGILFDLDGTLVDSAPALTKAVNFVRHEAGLQPIDIATLRPHITGGTVKMLEIGLGISPKDSNFNHTKATFLDYYAAHLADDAALFDGIQNLLDDLNHKKIPWGIVTNKHTRFTKPLLKALNLSEHCDALICGDTLTTQKPDPAPLQAAAKELQVPIDSLIMVGDAPSDMLAAKNAGMKGLAVLYGYISEADKALFADYEQVSTPEALHQTLLTFF